MIADDLRARVRPEVLIKANLVSHATAASFNPRSDSLGHARRRARRRCHGGSLSPKGPATPRSGFDPVWSIAEQAFGRPVEFLDLNRDETAWDRLELAADVHGSPLVARVSRTVRIERTCRVSLALMKTHVTSMVTFGLKNMLSSIHPDDRIMMHGHAGGGNGYHGWKRLVVEFLKGDSTAVNALTRAMGRARRLQAALLGKNRSDAWTRLKPSEIGYLRSVEAMNRNLVGLSRVAKPHVSVVDGFLAMHREGPRHGTPIKLGTVVAGTDAGGGRRGGRGRHGGSTRCRSAT